MEEKQAIGGPCYDLGKVFFYIPYIKNLNTCTEKIVFELGKKERKIWGCAAAERSGRIPEKGTESRANKSRANASSGKYSSPSPSSAQLSSTHLLSLYGERLIPHLNKDPS